jgi:hypothetical protein
MVIRAAQLAAIHLCFSQGLRDADKGPAHL